ACARCCGVHNTMGRFFDEKIYQAEFRERCLRMGIDARREVEIRVRHLDFSKSYYIDLLVSQGCVYEFKTATALNPAHDKQVIQYLLLAGLNHGKLVNFRPRSVDSRFVSTSLRREDRSAFTIEAIDWQGRDGILEHNLLAILNDWGTFLEAGLYREALLHLTQSPVSGEFAVPVIINGRETGHQNLCMSDEDTAWHLSAIRKHHTSYELHIRRLLTHTPVTRLHWININQRQVTLKTLFQ
ncbi:MAG: GxxExxY protein, partial [Verrucomicrobiaceae bacterium]